MDVTISNRSKICGFGTIQVKPNGRGGHDVFLDGEEVPGVRYLFIEMRAGCAAKVKIECLMTDVDVECKN